MYSGFISAMPHFALPGVILGNWHCSINLKELMDLRRSKLKQTGKKKSIHHITSGTVALVCLFAMQNGGFKRRVLSSSDRCPAGRTGCWTCWWTDSCCCRSWWWCLSRPWGPHHYIAAGGGKKGGKKLSRTLKTATWDNLGASKSILWSTRPPPNSPGNQVIIYICPQPHSFILNCHWIKYHFNLMSQQRNNVYQCMANLKITLLARVSGLKMRWMLRLYFQPAFRWQLIFLKSQRQATEFAKFNLFAVFLNLYLHRDSIQVRHVYEHKLPHLMRKYRFNLPLKIILWKGTKSFLTS